MRVVFLTLILQTTLMIYAQPDTTWYSWPLDPQSVQKNISGTFGEYRSTSTSGHFHNGTDIPAAPGTPVLAVLPGVVAAAYHDGLTGYDSYVRVTSNINGQSKNITYYHTIPAVSVGQNVIQGQQLSTIQVRCIYYHGKHHQFYSSYGRTLLQ
jgi:murein DD-endopeptidase MepM/ murein hydrolase activator NlpD